MATVIHFFHEMTTMGEKEVRRKVLFVPFFTDRCPPLVQSHRRLLQSVYHTIDDGILRFITASASAGQTFSHAQR